MAAGLAEKTAEAQRDAQALREKLEEAELRLNEALEDRRYADAETLKQRVDALREPVLIADAHLTALRAGLAALQAQQEADQQAAADRARRDQADVLMEAARTREAAARDDVERLLAEMPVAYAELRRMIAEAEAAQLQVQQAQADFHHAGVAAGHIDPAAPLPWGWNRATAWIEASPVLMTIRRTELAN
jgi:hypothetical protein